MEQMPTPKKIDWDAKTNEFYAVAVRQSRHELDHAIFVTGGLLGTATVQLDAILDYLAVLERRLLDLETACTASPSPPATG